MKILYIDVNCKNSSTGDIVYNLNKCCEQNGIESSVCYGRGPKIKEKNIFKFGLDFETYLHAFLTRITGYTGCYSYFSTRRLIKYINRYKPDIVHIHELHAYFVNVKQLLIYLKNHNIPTIFTNHCEFIYTGKCGHSKTCNKYSIKCGHCPLLKEYPKSLFFDHTKYMLDVKNKIFKDWENTYFVNPSKWIDNKMKSSFLREKKHSIIHNAIDTSIFKYCGSTKQGNYVLSIAQDIFSDSKGGKLVLNIADKMKDFNFILIGSKGKNIPEKDNVEIYSHIYDKTKLAKMYSNASSFLILSQYENYPTTCLEAQCCGTKVIGYDVGGIKETIIKDGGVVFPYLDEENIIKTIKQYSNISYDKKLLSEKARKQYSYSTMINQYFNIYRKILK